ncbi:MAG TPA: vWA domain-containing protein [Inquilinus sp.]|nr:vWA domain-containing protein [Inquilinus sp.]
MTRAIVRRPNVLRTLLLGSALGALLAGPAWAVQGQGRPQVEVAFVLDTTGSMADLIDGAKRKIWSIATTIVEANPDAEIRIALVAYRDRGDDYVTRTYELTTDIQGLYGKLLQLRADGGGDWPESVNEALHDAVNKVHWSQGGQARKIVFLVGDAPPHMDYANAPKYAEVVAAARKNGIIVNAVQAGNAGDTRQIWQDIAQRGAGRYIPIPQDGGQVVVIETPYDGDIIILQRRIDATVIPYGSAGQQESMLGKIEQRAAAPASVQADNSGFYSKRTGRSEVVTGAGDLVADIASGAKALGSVADDELPDVLKGKTAEERQAYVAQQQVERAALTTEMAALVGQRDSFIEAEQAKQAGSAPVDSFDRAVEETLRTQLE